MSKPTRTELVRVREDCEGCKYSKGPISSLAKIDCRRYPPQVSGETRSYSFSEFPQVYLSDWCGEFKPKEARP